MYTIARLSLIILAALICFPLQAAANDKNNEPHPFTHDSWKADARRSGMAPMASRSNVEDTISQATQLFEEAMRAPASQAIPASEIENAAGIAIFPRMSSMAMEAGGNYNSGVIMPRQADGEWSSPLFVSLTGGPIGTQGNVNSSDLVLVFKDRQALEAAARGQDFTLGSDAIVASGDVGQSASFRTDAQILAYSYTSVGFSGTSVDGSVLNVEADPTIAYYNMTGGEAAAHGYYDDRENLYNEVIVYGGQNMKSTPQSANDLQRAIDDYVSAMKNRS